MRLGVDGTIRESRAVAEIDLRAASTALANDDGGGMLAAVIR